MFYLIVSAILVAFAILAYKNLKLALAILAGILPLYLIRFELGSLPTTLLELLIIIIVVIWLTKYKSWKTKLAQYRKWFWPTVLLLLAATIGIFVAPDTLDALGIWKAYFVEPMLLFLVLLTTLEKKEDLQMLFQALAITAIVLSLIAIVQYVTGFGIPAPWDIEGRVTSIFDYPNALGLFLAPIVGLSVVMLQEQRRALWLVTILLGIVAIVLAKTEAALVAVPAGLLLTLLLSSAPKKTKILVLSIAVILGAVLFAVSGTVRSKILLEDYSGQVRRSQWSETIELLQDKPIFGAGLNGYPTALEPYHDPTFYEIFQYPHNIILNIWSELGVLGFIAVVWLAWLVLKTMKDCFASKTGSQHSKLLLAAFAALMIMAIHGLVDVPFFKNDLAVMTMMMLAVVAQKEDPATKE